MAFRKAQGLSRSGCRPTVVALEFSPAFRAWLEEHRFQVERRAYRDGEAAQYFLVISATDDAEVNQSVFEDAQRAGRLINVVDQPGLCNVYIPSRIERGNLQVSISTADSARPLPAGFGENSRVSIPERYGLLLDRVAAIRARVKETFPSPDARRRVLERLLHSEAARRFLAGDDRLLNKMDRGWERANSKRK